MEALKLSSQLVRAHRPLLFGSVSAKRGCTSGVVIEAAATCGPRSKARAAATVSSCLQRCYATALFIRMRFIICACVLYPQALNQGYCGYSKTLSNAKEAKIYPSCVSKYEWEGGLKGSAVSIFF